MKISIIIPVYNAMNFIEECLKGVLNQTYKDLEIILVDNNSKDGSFEYIKSIAEKDNRVKAFTEGKQGPNFARKAGFDIATGDYILFCDADDYMHEDAVEKFVNEIEKNDSDVVIGNYCEIKRNREIIKEKKGIINNQTNTNLKEHKDIIHIKPALWNKIFKKDIIKDDFFITSFIGEDMVITISSMMLANKITYINNIVYDYVPNDEGLSNSVNVRNLLNIITTVEELKKIAKKYNTYEQYRGEIEFLCFTHVIYRILRTVMMENDKERTEVYNQLSEYLKKNNEYKKTLYYKKKIYYRIANAFLLNKKIYNLRIFRSTLKLIFKNKTIYKCFKKMDN